VICGGVAASRGDFWCTSMAERSFVCGVVWPRLAGEKLAYVGLEFESPVGGGDDASLLDLEGVDMCCIQGVSSAAMHGVVRHRLAEQWRLSAALLSSHAQ